MKYTIEFGVLNVADVDDLDRFLADLYTHDRVDAMTHDAITERHTVRVGLLVDVATDDVDMVWAVVGFARDVANAHGMEITSSQVAAAPDNLTVPVRPWEPGVDAPLPEVTDV